MSVLNGTNRLSPPLPQKRKRKEGEEGGRKRKPASRRLSPNQRLALVVGGVATFVLALSIWECTAALAVLTGMPLALAAMLAVGIDCGMVVCEIVAVAQCTKEEARRWAERYVHLAVGMSVMLNAVAAASHAEGWWKVAGATAGALVPILIYIAGRVAGNSWAGR